MGIPVKAGRDFSPQDLVSEQGTIVINEPLARRLWPGQDPIGRPLLTDWPGTYTVIGIAADVRQASLEERPVFQMYLPYSHVPAGSLDLIIRSPLPPASVASGVRATLASVDRDLMSSELRPVEDLVERSVSPRRFLARLMGGFSLLALALACLGIYGVVSYTVSQRVHEIGVRVALGATAGDIRRHVVHGTLRLAALGVALGLVGAVAVARLIAALLYETSPFDPATFAGTALVLMAVAVVAGYVPARRAARLDPISALRVQ
jgi:predicted permease